MFWSWGVAWALDLSVTEGAAGGLVVRVDGAKAHERVTVVASTEGAGPGRCPPSFGGLCLGVKGPLSTFELTADGLGSVSRRVEPPAGAKGVAFQAAGPRSRALSAVVEVDLRPVIVDAACEPQDNALRFDCTVTTDRPAQVTIEAFDGRDVVAQAASPREATEHTLTLVGLQAQRSFDVVATASTHPEGVWEGAVTTGALPAAVDLQLGVVRGAGATVGSVLFNMGCGDTDHLVIASADGDVLWYDDVSRLDPAAVVTRGFALADDGVLVLVDRFGVARLGFDGSVTTLPSGPELPVHHDLVAWGGLIGAVDAEAVQYPNGVTYVVDGVSWFDPETGERLARFATDSVNDPTIVAPKASGYWAPLFPGATDWAHTNALVMDDDGTGILSYKSLNALQKVVLDPLRPDFGEVVWTLTGKAVSPLVSDFTRLSSAGVSPLTFGDQHHVTILPDGDLLIFDNQPGPAVSSRALRLRVDEAAGTADLVEQWSLGRSCPAQGSAVLLPSGNVLVDCAIDDTLLEIEAGTQAVVWSMTASCPNGASPPRPLYRALPVEGFGG